MTCKCKNCKNFKYNEEYDAFYCSERKVWLETTCGDKHCEFCSKKPRYPLQLEKRKVKGKEVTENERI